jgi:hypothetical protein
MISYHTYCSLKEQICRNANLPISTSVTEWQELTLRHFGIAGDDLGQLVDPLLVAWSDIGYEWCLATDNWTAVPADSVPLSR